MIDTTTERAKIEGIFKPNTDYGMELLDRLIKAMRRYLDEIDAERGRGGKMRAALEGIVGIDPDDIYDVKDLYAELVSAIELARKGLKG